MHRPALQPQSSTQTTNELLHWHPPVLAVPIRLALQFVVLASRQSRKRVITLAKIVFQVIEGGGGTHMPAYRRLGIRVITATSNLSNELGIRDTQSGFRAFSARALDRLRFDAEGMELSLEMLEDAQEKQLHVREVPTVIRYDVPKGSNYTAVSHGFTVLSWALISLSQKKPLLVLGLPGVGLFATGAAMGLNVAQNVTNTLDTFLGDGLTAIWVGVLGLSLMATGLVLQGVRSLLRHLIVEHFGID